VKRLVEKIPQKLLELGRRLVEAKRTLSADAFDSFMHRELELQHESRPGQLLRDKARRLAQVALLRVLWDFIAVLPCTGWSTLRELPKLGEATLRCLLERGAINRSTTREDVDRLRSAQKRGNVAARHRGDWERGART
jgi:hypothetical protein